MVAVLRVVGPPGSGKTLLIVSLAEALRSRGHRVATVVRREALASPLALEPGAHTAATVIVLSNGGRVTMAGALPLARLEAVIPSLDPSVDLILAEGFADAGYPAVELSPSDGPAPSTARADLLAIVASDAIAGAFARFGPGETNGLAGLVERTLLGGAPAPATTFEASEASGRGRLARALAALRARWRGRRRPGRGAR